MKRLSTIALALGVALGVRAGDFSVLVDRAEKPLAEVKADFPGFAYVADPTAGGEDLVLKYRHAGAWTFRTAKVDKETLEFLLKYGMRIVLLMDGEPSEMAAKLKLICDGGYEKAVVGFQLGTKVIGKDDVAKWNSVVGQIRHRFGKTPIAMPATAGVPEIAKLMPGVSHLVFDLKSAQSPYEPLRKAFSQVMGSKIPCVRHLRFWAVAPAKIPGDEQADAWRASLWSAQFLLTAYSTELVDAVFFDRPPAEDDFGWMLRALAPTLKLCPKVLLYGEGQASKAGGAKASVGDTELSLETEDGGEGLGDDTPIDIKAKPRACADFASKRGGDVSYLFLANDVAASGVTAWGARMGCLVVNGSDKPVKMSAEMKRGKASNGESRSLFLDPETKKVDRKALGCWVQPGMPLVRWLKPHSIESVTFVSQR